MCAHQVSINQNGNKDEEKTESVLSLKIENVDDYSCKLELENGGEGYYYSNDIEVSNLKMSPNLLDANAYSNNNSSAVHDEHVVALLDDEKIKEDLESGKNKAKRRKTKRYYNRQLKLLENYNHDDKFVQKFAEDESTVHFDDDTKQQKWDIILATASLIANICLFVAKIVAAALSGSLVVISSVIDSAMDLTTGAVIFGTNRAIKKRDLHKYPRGRTRLEPLALIIISVIMGAANVQVKIA